jgi:hypothetical protein
MVAPLYLSFAWNVVISDIKTCDCQQLDFKNTTPHGHLRVSHGVTGLNPAGAWHFHHVSPTIYHSVMFSAPVILEEPNF